ncbi:hypothetical protein ACU635_59170 [[Actinomadura] parvosata]|uniref:hypothetical protein n=1 Tax=[Actinomadura] parvosata TaxID=1955412 RepID=UPI00406CE06D
METETSMKLGDTHIVTMGRDTPTHASHVAAMAATSLNMVLSDKNVPIPPADLDAVVGDMWTMTAKLCDLARRLAPAAVEPRTREALTEAERALNEASRALFQADPEGPA